MKTKCPQCDFENEEGSKFCKNCNAPLSKQDYSEDNLYAEKNVDEEDKIKNKIEKEEKIQKEVFKMNRTQRLILAILVPIIFFFIFKMFTDNLDGSYCTIFGFGINCYVLPPYLILCCIFEYKLFADKKKKDKELKENKNNENI